MITSPFTVIVDTREQHPFHFANIPVDRSQLKKKLADGIDPGVVIVKTLRACLPTGDYAADGLQDRMAIERKSKSDLFHCMGADRERFEEQVRRLSELQRGILLVESDWPSILQGCENTRLNPKVIHRTVMSWQVKYPSVHWWFCPTRGFAEVTAYRILEKWWHVEHN